MLFLIFWSMIQKVLSILYPKLCIACESHLLDQEKFLCIYCTHQMNWVPVPENNLPNLERIFFGKFNYRYLNSLLFYDNDRITKALLHHLKYKNKPEIGNWLAEWTYQRYHQHIIFKGIDALIKTPIHTKRLKERGYNQLDNFAQVISQKFNIPIYDDVLIRTQYTTSQTQKKMRERLFENTPFELKNHNRINNKHILVVDDVITTGNTMEQIVSLLQTAQPASINIFAIATAK